MTENGSPAVEVTRYCLIRQASYWQGIIRGLPNMIVLRFAKNQAGKVATPAVHVIGYRADLDGDAVTPAMHSVQEANGVTILDPATPQHVLG